MRKVKTQVRKNYWHNNSTRRAFTYKSLNKLIQGSAADMTKKAMVELHKEGILAHIQVHDELDFSVESDSHAGKIKENYGTRSRFRSSKQSRL